MRYRDRLTIQKPGTGGYRDPTTGQWIVPAGVAVYNGPADVQDEGAVLQWSNGQPVLTSDAVAYLPKIPGIRAMAKLAPNQTAKIQWGRDGTLSDAQVARVKRSGICVYLKFV